MNYIDEAKERNNVTKISKKVVDDLVKQAGYRHVYEPDYRAIRRLSPNRYRYGMKVLVDQNGREKVFDSAKDVANYLNDVLNDYEQLGIKRQAGA